MSLATLTSSCTHAIIQHNTVVNTVQHVFSQVYVEPGLEQCASLVSLQCTFHWWAHMTGSEICLEWTLKSFLENEINNGGAGGICCGVMSFCENEQQVPIQRQ